MIPKILHYVWINKAKGFPEKIKKAMASLLLTIYLGLNKCWLMGLKWLVRAM